jgi:hypothetical protein
VMGYHLQVITRKLAEAVDVPVLAPAMVLAPATEEGQPAGTNGQAR